MSLPHSGRAVAALHASYLKSLDAALQAYFAEQLATIKQQHADVLRKLARRLQTLRSEFQSHESQNLAAFARLKDQINAPENAELVARMMQIRKDLYLARSYPSTRKNALDAVCSYSQLGGPKKPLCAEHGAHSQIQAAQQQELAQQCRQLCSEIDYLALAIRKRFSLSSAPQ